MRSVSERLAEIEIKIEKTKAMLLSLRADLVFLNNLLSSDHGNRKAREIKGEIEWLLSPCRA